MGSGKTRKAPKLSDKYYLLVYTDKDNIWVKVYIGRVNQSRYRPGVE